MPIYLNSFSRLAGDDVAICSGVFPMPNAPPITTASSYVLIENHADGFQTVYASDGVHVLSFNRPAISSARCASVLDQMIDEVLPLRFAEIRNARNIVTTGIQKRLTVAELVERCERMIEFYAYCSINADHRFSLSNATLEILKV